MALVITESYDDYLLLFFLLLIEIWGAKFSRDSTLFFFLLLIFYTIWLKMQDILYFINLIGIEYLAFLFYQVGILSMRGEIWTKKKNLKKNLMK